MGTWLSLQRIDPSYLYHKSERLWVLASVFTVSPVTQTQEGGKRKRKRKEGGRERGEEGGEKKERKKSTRRMGVTAVRKR